MNFPVRMNKSVDRQLIAIGCEKVRGIVAAGLRKKDEEFLIWQSGQNTIDRHAVSAR
ncbi:hypothetical protein [Burkholderia sp. Ac-20365]|uniref:hypothetical protein n=1 Tax=Burkholderia sp. Ac-20365 TaxID=2703897 RepID=UPI00197B32A8|nr:hypothetical protein [Burkholderia sp. Ac-20365]MBN3761750.1 hypothetical protein [Burkholderia sp. Ac-20365]